MTDDRFEQALQALRKSTVRPVLIPEDRLLSASASSWPLAAIGGVILALVVTTSMLLWHRADGLLEGAASTTSFNEKELKLHTVPIASSDRLQPSPLVSASIEIDDGLLVIDLTPEELREFGVTVHEEGARVTIERVLVAGQYYGALTEALREIGIEKDDSLTLIRASVDVTADTVFRERLVGRADIKNSEHLSVLACRRNIVSHGSEFDAFFSAILDDSLMSTFVYWSMDSVMDRIVPTVTDGVVKTSAGIWADRTRRPVIWTHRFPGSDRMLLVFFLPTHGVRSTLPARYRTDFDRLYERYVPRLPAMIRAPDIWKPEWQRPNLVLAAEQAGLTAIEPANSELWRLGIAVGADSIAIASASLDPHYRRGELVSIGDTITMVSTSYRPFVVDSINPTAAYTYSDTVRFVQSGTSGQTWNFEIPEASSYRVAGVDGQLRLGSIGSSGTTLQSLDTTWRRRYPFFSTLAFRVAYELSTTFTSIDSLLRYEVVVGGLRIPVTKILVPVRVVGPYGHRTKGDTSLVRADVVYWYTPSDRFFSSLPDGVRHFVEEEYAAIARILEDHLSAAELCALLDKPSAFGLCSIGDTTLRIDGVGPIPARESFTVFLQCASTTTASIKLISDDGRTVLERSQIPLAKGANQIPVQLAGQNIPQGAYTVVVTCAEGTRTSRVLVATH